ncbi:hypothetical protein [Pyrobaculum islandicum]|uniref:hypothetical protein n=1 Tax=Pyrobaculum islandicum TaxID=2277 RepID=UPI000B10654B|nr:hypothetical protein [Pyrobaculum islandicum]
MSSLAKALRSAGEAVESALARAAGALRELGSKFASLAEEVVSHLRRGKQTSQLPSSHRTAANHWAKVS